MHSARCEWIGHWRFSGVPRGLFPSWPDCITGTFEYSFRRGHRQDFVWINEVVMIISAVTQAMWN